MNVRETIVRKLESAFHPSAVEVIDESHLHQGHAGHRPGGESHFRIRIIAEAFRGMSRLETHRRVYDVLRNEIEGGLHALAIEARAP
jgi:BolA family transcriptional regulator, general stress-responsive regulator